MVEAHPCAVCGKPTKKRILFKDASEEAYVCSLACENQYFESLRYRGEKQKLAGYLDAKIRTTKRFELGCWAIAAVGLLSMLLGVFLANHPSTKALRLGAPFFIFGLIPLTGGALSTLHFSGIRERLVRKKKQLA